MTPSGAPQRRAPFFAGVFLISFAVLMFQVVQTRILSVIAWYYLAFFGISMAMLGMTAGAVYAYLQRERLASENLGVVLTRFSLVTAVSMPLSLLMQLSLVTSLSITLTTVAAWALLTMAMAIPYCFAGVAISLALTRSPYPVNLVYGADLVGAALGCALVLLVLNVVDAPSAILVAAVIAALAARCFAAGTLTQGVRIWQRSGFWVVGLTILLILNVATPLRIRPVLVKDLVEKAGFSSYEKWNSYSRIMALPPSEAPPFLWGASPKMPETKAVSEIYLNIDGAAGTTMPHFDGTAESIDHLHYDVVNLGYHLPDLRKGAVIGVGGGRDLMSAHLFGVAELVGVELNPVFVHLHTVDPFYREFSGLTRLPSLHLHVDDARSWFASTRQKFDIVQMSMIDTWAATGAGAFSLSENGLYTLEGWRTFFRTLEEGGVFTVSRWYSPGNVNETGRMIALAVGTLHDAGVANAREHLFVAHADHIATLVMSKKPFTPAQIAILNERVESLGFGVLVAPDRPAASALLDAILDSKSVTEIDRIVSSAYLDLTVPTDNRPFFFNQLKLGRIVETVRELRKIGRGGVLAGNLLATVTLMLILLLSMVAVCATIIIPLRGAAKDTSRTLIHAGTSYFALIGLGFMLAEIAILQYFSVYLGHPIYSLGVCLFSLILATGLGSLLSSRIDIGRPASMAIWAMLVTTYLLVLQWKAAGIFELTADRALEVRIGLSLAMIVPLGLLLGFAFPTGMRLVAAVDPAPTPWFWGINGATGVLASVLAVMLSMNFGIDVTATISGLCYLALIPVGWKLMALGRPVSPLGALATSTR